MARNFKRFGDLDIELGNPVLFIGPNNSGKTSALQALALWEIGLRRWNERRKGRQAPEKRPGVTINRKDLLAVPVPESNLLWRDLHVRDVRIQDGKQEIRNVRIDVRVEGISAGKCWDCGLEFDYANEESLYCRPLRLSEDRNPDRMEVPEEAAAIRLAFLPPMSGLAATESRLDRGAVNVRVGEGRTAEVLRNLCYLVQTEHAERWAEVVKAVEERFLVTLEPPEYLPERGEIVMGYRERDAALDISCAGRGLQQVLLLLVYMHSNPGAVLLLDEPDAHLEALRQRDVYQLLSDAARRNGSQIIAASHSEVLLAEAAGRDVVVAFVGRPHRIDDRGNRLLTALREIDAVAYYRASQAGWVLYINSPADMAVLREYALLLGHESAVKALESAYVRYGSGQVEALFSHFRGLREAVPKLAGVLVSGPPDLPPAQAPDGLAILHLGRWLDSYLCDASTLESCAGADAKADAGGPLFEESETARHLEAMRGAIAAARKADPAGTIEYLHSVFGEYHQRLGITGGVPSLSELARHVNPETLNVEVKQVLDAVAAASQGLG